ncbi:MAG: bi-domain-containing oxidoreductase, partial [Anaerolineales bacterium]
KARRDGILSTFDAVRNRLDQPFAPGYSCAGTVIEVGEQVSEFEVGGRVACAGGGYASHAEVVAVPRNLVVALPEHVDFESAAFTTLGAIALQGLRLAEIKLGEVVAVIGLGLLGQLTIQMLKASGCLVAGMDLNLERTELARRMGADAAVSAADEFAAVCAGLSKGRGVDVVLITADTKSNQPVELAGEIARDKGVVVAVGMVGMTIPRKPYYEKELDFRISRSYGPGRYDPEYEEKGRDYPIGYVRWTEKRNMQAFVQLLAEGKIDVKPLITHRFPIEQAVSAYDLIDGKTDEAFLGVLITYPAEPDLTRQVRLLPKTKAQLTTGPIAIGLLGAGNFARATLLPAIQKVRALERIGVCDASGVIARSAGRKYSFRYCTTDQGELLSDPDINTILIATRHNLHASQVLAALKAGKHVFCEKPLCLNEEELSEIVRSWNAIRLERAPKSGKGEAEPGGPRSPLLMVGYNRRFAPMSVPLKAFFDKLHEPLVMNYRVNAGRIASDHWLQDPEQGGGRIVGEVCHFVDLFSFLTEAAPIRVHASALPNVGRYFDDNVALTLEFSDGSVGSIVYAAGGDSAFPKERLEAFGGGGVAVLDDFRRLELVRHGRKKVVKAPLRKDKGHRAELEALAKAVQQGGPAPIAFESLVATTLTTFRALESLRLREPVEVNLSSFLSDALAQPQE